MKFKTMISSVACCVVLTSSHASAMQVPQKNMDLIDIQEEKDMRVVVDNCVMKKGPSDFSRDVIKLNKDSVVEVMEDESIWLKVKVDEKIGYLRVERLKRMDNKVTTKYVEGIEYIDVYSDMSGYRSKIIGKIKNGEKVSIIDELGQYIKIRWEEGEGYIKNIKDCLVKRIRSVVKENTVLYLNRSKKTIHSKVKAGEVVEIEEELRDLYRVRYKQDICYIKKEALKNEKYIYDENNSVVKLYTMANKNSQIRTYIPTGTSVEVIRYEKDYAYIKYGEYTGYVNTDALTRKETVLMELVGNVVVSKKLVDRKEVEDMYKIINSNLSKEKDDAEFEEFKDKYGIIEIPNKKINIIKNKGRYFEVEVGNQKYYMDNTGINEEEESVDNLTYIDLYPTIAPKSKTRYILEMDTKVYLDKEMKIVLGELPKDAQVEYIDSDSEVSKIYVNGTEVYVESSKLSNEKMYTRTTRNINISATNTGHKFFVEEQVKKLNVVMKNSGSERAHLEELAYYSNPDNFSVWNNEYKYQYLKLNTFRMINTSKLDRYLDSLTSKNGKENIFKGKADIFVASAKKYNIDPIYLVAHTLLETGMGKSNLAQGQMFKGVKVYNLFGIGAVDSNPLNKGKETAYMNGWTSIDKAIEGSAKWLSDNYINSRINKQNTLYKMRFNYMTRSHQYATDIAWCVKISRYMNELSYMYEDTELSYEIPVYNRGTYLAGKRVYKEDIDKEEDELLVDKDTNKDQNNSSQNGSNSNNSDQNNSDQNNSDQNNSDSDSSLDMEEDSTNGDEDVSNPGEGNDVGGDEIVEGDKPSDDNLSGDTTDSEISDSMDNQQS